jgi:hypothetical protein
MFKSINMVNMKQGARKGKERLKPGKPVNSANKKSRHVTSRHVTPRTVVLRYVCMVRTAVRQHRQGTAGRINIIMREYIHTAVLVKSTG